MSDSEMPLGMHDRLASDKTKGAKLWLLAKFAITLTCFAVVFAKVGARPVWNRILSTPSTAILLLSVSGALQLSIAVWRWRGVLRSLGGSVTWTVATRGVLVERFLNQALPSTLGGDAARIAELIDSKVPLAKALHSVIFDRFLGLAGIVLVMGATIPLNDLSSARSGLVTVTAGIFAAFAGGVALLSVPWSLGGGTIERCLPRSVLAFVETARKLLSCPRIWGYGFGLSVLIQLLICATVYAVAAEMQIALSLRAALTLVPGVIFFSLIPFSIAGWGAREGAMVALLGLEGVASRDALTLSVLLGIAQLLLGLVGGLLRLGLSRNCPPKSLA